MKRINKDVWKRTERRRERLKGASFSKKKVNEQFGRKMNEDKNGNKKLFWMEGSNEKGGKVESCSRVKGRNERLTQREDDARKIWKEHFEDLYSIDTQKEVAVHICGFGGIRRCN